MMTRVHTAFLLASLGCGALACDQAPDSDQVSSTTSPLSLISLRLRLPVDQGALAVDAGRNGSLAPTSYDIYHVSGLAGQRVRFSVASTYYAPSLTVVAPSGGSYFGTPTRGAFFLQVSQLDLTLPGAGDYQVVVSTASVGPSGAYSLTARNLLPMVAITIQNNGGGSVTWPGGSCVGLGTCTANLPQGAQATFTAVPFDGNVFMTWGRPCCGEQDDPALVLTATQPETATVYFLIGVTAIKKPGGLIGTQDRYRLFPAIECGTIYNSCSGYAGTPEVYIATPSPGYHLIRWGGACAGTPVVGHCLVRLEHPYTVWAEFAPDAGGFQLDVTNNLVGWPGGASYFKVLGDGIDCGPACSQIYPPGTLVTLTAAPSLGGFQWQWGGDCAAFGYSPTCTVTMDQARQASIYFFSIY